RLGSATVSTLRSTATEDGPVAPVGVSPTASGCSQHHRMGHGLGGKSFRRDAENSGRDARAPQSYLHSYVRLGVI
ncbi:MAG TPA: hypothetical protein VGK40_08050, partial [Verrucomicrobiae bacterium]